MRNNQGYNFFHKENAIFNTIFLNLFSNMPGISVHYVLTMKILTYVPVVYMSFTVSDFLANFNLLEIFSIKMLLYIN